MWGESFIYSNLFNRHKSCLFIYLNKRVSTYHPVLTTNVLKIYISLYDFLYDHDIKVFIQR